MGYENKGGESMTDRKLEIITTVGITTAIILFLMSGLDAAPKLDNVLVFAGVSLILIIAAIKKLSR